MAEKNIELISVEPIVLFGVNDAKLDYIRTFFPKLKIIARGNMIKVIGDLEQIIRFEESIDAFQQYFKRYGTLTHANVESVMSGAVEGNSENKNGEPTDILVYGNQGLLVKPRTAGQIRLVESSTKNDMVFAIGPAGTGKTYTAVAIAVRALKNKEVRKIILTRPAVEAGENLGFLPGDLKEKLDPYLQPLYDALRDMIAPDKLFKYLEDGTIEIAPLAFMRGRTLDNAVVLLDEAQNATESQLRMFLTRMGRTAKFIITGDVTQIDLPRNQPSGLIQSIRVLKDVKGIAFIELDATDVIRHRLVRSIIQAYSNENNR